MSRFSAFLLCFACAADAQDGGFTTGAGVQLAPAQVAGPQGRAIFADDQGRFIIQPSPPSGGQSGDLECWPVDGGAKLSTLPNSFTSTGGFSALFAGPGRTAFVTATWGVGGSNAINFTRASCATAAIAAGNLIYSTAFTPYGSAQGVLPMLSNGDVVYPTSSALIRVSLAAATPTTTMLLTTAVLDAALGAPDGGSVEQRFRGLAADPNDHLWGILERRVNAGPKLEWLVELTPAGQVIVRRGPTASVSVEGSIVYDGALDAMLFDVRSLPVGPAQPFEAIGVVPLAGRDGLGARVPPWPAIPARGYFPPNEEWRGLFGASAGGAWLATFRTAYAVRSLGFAPALADFDRDGLTRAEEDALGTSDFVADSDGDGVNDGLELRLTFTSPADAGSAPPIPAAGDVVLAESLFAATWGIDAGPGCFHSGGYSSGRALALAQDEYCLDGLVKYVFLGPDGKPLSAVVAESGAPPLLTEDLGHAFLLKGPSTWTRLDLDAGTSVPVDLGGRVVGELFPLTKDVVLATEVLLAPKLWRFGPQGAFAVIDLSRPCPVAGNVAELALCRPLSGVTSFRLRGWDPLRKLALAVVTTDHGRMLFGIGEDRAVFLTELLATGEGLEPVFLAPLGSRGFAMQLAGKTVTEGFVGTVRLDGLFRPAPGANTLDTTDPLRTAGFFRSGFPSLVTDSYAVEPKPAEASSCTKFGATFTCKNDALPVVLQTVPRQYLAEFIPVGPALEKGEVLFFAAGLYGEGTMYRGRDGGYGGYAGGPGWRLWRFTVTGAALPWLDAEQLAAAADAATRAKLITRPLGQVTAMAASPDALGVCLVESDRVWELKLDPVSRRLSGVTLTELAAGAVGCAWEAPGTLAILTARPVTIRTVAKTLPVNALEIPSGLLRLGGKWVVFTNGRAARCVDDDATVTSTTLKTIAFAPAFGGVAWLDETGQAFLTPAESFCSSGVRERLGETSTNVWMDAYAPLTFRSINAFRGAIALRPDGVMLLGAPSLSAGGLGLDPPSVPRLLFAYFPSYVPLEATRMTDVDPFRAARPRVFVAARKPADISAMVLLPGADASTDFGHLARPAPVVAVPPRDGGIDGGTAPTPKPCGCRAIDGGLAALALLLLSRSRRPSSRGGPTGRTAPP